jgi:hypothetical protein
MRRIFAFIPGLALIGGAAHAQSKSGELRLNAGLAMPFGGNSGVGESFTRSYGNGFAFGAGVGRRIGASLLLGVNLDYTRFALDEAGYLDGSGGTVSGGEMSILSLGVDARYVLGGLAATAAPYVVAGASALKLSDVNLSLNTTGGLEETHYKRHGLAQDVGLHIGAGLRVRAGSSAHLLIEARGVIGLYDQASYIPVRAGVTFGL